MFITRNMIPPIVRPEGLGVLSPSVSSPWRPKGELMFIPLPEGPAVDPFAGDERKNRGEDDATPDCRMPKGVLFTFCSRSEACEASERSCSSGPRSIGLLAGTCEDSRARAGVIEPELRTVRLEAGEDMTKERNWVVKLSMEGEGVDENGPSGNHLTRNTIGRALACFWR